MDQIYKFKKKWISSSVNYIIDRFTASVYYASHGCKRIANRF